MKTPMTEEIQSVIIAVQAFKKFLIADMIARKVTDYSDIEHDVRAYYSSIDLPNVMKHNLACLNAVLSYPIADTLGTNAGELPLKFWFGY